VVDLFVLLVSPGGGDDLQGIKRGVMELADLILVTKADGDLAKAAGRAASDYHAALHLMRPKFRGIVATVMKVSAIEGTGIAQAWSAMTAYHAALAETGQLKTLRQDQARAWFRTEVQAVLADEIARDPDVAHRASGLEAEVVAGKALPHAAARALIRAFRHA
jgi:LAO/AO transport system kinase